MISRDAIRAIAAYGCCDVNKKDYIREFQDGGNELTNQERLVYCTAIAQQAFGGSSLSFGQDWKIIALAERTKT